MSPEEHLQTSPRKSSFGYCRLCKVMNPVIVYLADNEATAAAVPGRRVRTGARCPAAAVRARAASARAQARAPATERSSRRTQLAAAVTHR